MGFMHTMFRHGAVARFGLCLFALTTVLRAQVDAPRITFQEKRTWDFAEDGVAFSNQFSEARLSDCQRTAPLEYLLTIAPENAPINPSPWYAFKVTSAKAQTIRLAFRLTAAGSVIRPRLSTDGRTWSLLDQDAFTPAPKSRETLVPDRATARIVVGPGTLWVAAQEMIGLAELGAWMDAKARLPFARESNIGVSIERRPLRQLIFAETAAPDYVFIISRQHPPEVTGTIALMEFVDTLTGAGELARRYRRSFQTVVVPLVNPDGIEHGHWRHNLGGVDTNRDWKPFTQPETRAVRDSLLQLGKAPHARTFLFLDFHSTGSDVFYSQPDSDTTFPPLFASKWLGALARRLPDYRFERDEAHNVGLPTSKSWAYETFGCAGITYELGYNTDRDLIKKVSAAAAEEMMQLLLTESAGAKE
jgi:cytosolic carboxypeptidase protein 6